MKTKLLPIIVALALISQTVSANQNGFGLGIMLGEPTGPCFKYWTGSKTAIDGGIAWSLDKNSNLHIHGDYLIHDFTLIKVDKGRLPFYYGIGGRIRTWDNNRDDNVGVRIPVGLSYLPENSAFDFFLEIVPILDLAPNTEMDFNGAIGVRYFFGTKKANGVKNRK
jgi:hypothetical protein